VTLVAARAPLVAFNVELAPPAGLREAAAIAAAIREGGADGLPGLRAIGVALRRPLRRGRARAAEEPATLARAPREERIVGQVSMNVERPTELPLAEVVAAVARYAPVARAELVGLAPRAALAGFPQELAMPGFDPARHVIENALLTK
jgi:glutamate formiminotransferase